MNIFSSIVNGLFTGVGVVIGVFLCFAYVVAKIRKQPVYDPNDLLISFEKYSEKLIREEWYEQRGEVLGIINALKSGVVPAEIYLYNIKKDIAVQADNKSDITIFKIKKSYTVTDRKISYVSNK